MDARSALFDVFGDHVSRRGGWAPVSGLVRILEALGVASPATRTAISRMAREGWLVSSEHSGQRGYYATQRAQRHLSEAYDRVYRLRPFDWNGHWDMVVITYDGDRSSRGRLARSLQYLGYAPMTPGVWVAPRRSTELSERLAAEGAQWEGFASAYDGDDAAFAAGLWDLDGLASAYRDFIAALDADAVKLDRGITAKEAFVMRTRIVHRWRLFLFTDPGLPARVLPADWPGQEATLRFEQEAGALMELTNAFVDHCFGSLPELTDPSPKSARLAARSEPTLAHTEPHRQRSARAR